jgi:hypothetical protein
MGYDPRMALQFPAGLAVPLTPKARADGRLLYSRKVARSLVRLDEVLVAFDAQSGTTERRDIPEVTVISLLGGVALRGERAAAGDAGAACLAEPRLTAFGRVSARLKRDWLRRGPDLLPAHLVCCITPHDRFIDDLNLPLADCV